MVDLEKRIRETARAVCRLHDWDDSAAAVSKLEPILRALVADTVSRCRQQIREDPNNLWDWDDVGRVWADRCSLILGDMVATPEEGSR